MRPGQRTKRWVRGKGMGKGRKQCRWKMAVKGGAGVRLVRVNSLDSELFSMSMNLFPQLHTNVKMIIR